MVKAPGDFHLKRLVPLDFRSGRALVRFSLNRRVRVNWPKTTTVPFGSWAPRSPLKQMLQFSALSVPHSCALRRSTLEKLANFCADCSPQWP